MDQTTTTSAAVAQVAERAERRRMIDRAWCRKNPEKRKAANAAWEKKRRAWFQEFKRGLKCVRCGESHPACLQFHHRDKTEKEVDISVAAAIWSEKRLLAEIAKCDVLCANCHAKEHAA